MKKELEESEKSNFNLRHAAHPPPEIVYVDDANKVSEELKAEIKKAKAELKEAQKEKIEVVKRIRENIASGMEKKFKELQDRETAQVSRISYLQKN
ncbi:MAG: hypothetical protein RLZZ419_1595 [Pseudomonadota bacterium]|jgi:ribosomal protein L7/L12